jgi:hypothetical protein
MLEANRYSVEEPRDVVTTARLRIAGFKKFSPLYFWQNFWGHVVEIEHSLKRSLSRRSGETIGPARELSTMA